MPRTSGAIAAPAQSALPVATLPNLAQLPVAAQQVQQPGPFTPPPNSQAPLTIGAPSAQAEPAPARRRRRTQAEMQAAQTPAQPNGAAAAAQAPFPHPGQNTQPAPAPAAFGIAQPSAASPDIKAELDSFFGKQG